MANEGQGGKWGRRESGGIQGQRLERILSSVNYSHAEIKKGKRQLEAQEDSNTNGAAQLHSTAAVDLEAGYCVCLPKQAVLKGPCSPPVS